MKIIAGFVLFSCWSALHAQVMWQITNTEVVKWKYHSGDEFNGHTINENYWYTGPPYGRANIVFDSYHAAENIFLKDGYLNVVVDSHDVLKPIEEWLLDTVYLKRNNISSANGLYKFNYTAGMLWSKPLYKYGYFEARFKADKGQGLWPAFWLYGQNQSDEIDFFELKGEKMNAVHVDVHCKRGCDGGYKSGWRKVNWGGWVDVKQYLCDGFNTLSGIWEPGCVTWFLNGYMIAKFKGNFETNMSLILNAALAKDNYAFSPGPNATTPFPAGMQVDYVRVFGKADTTQAGSDPFFTPVKDTHAVIVPKIIKTKSYIFKRKRDDDVNGFISYFKLNQQTLLFEVKGKFSNPVLSLTDSGGKQVISCTLKNYFNEVDISNASHGDYTLLITINGNNIIEEKIHLGH